MDFTLRMGGWVTQPAPGPMQLGAELRFRSRWVSAEECNLFTASVISPCTAFWNPRGEEPPVHGRTPQAQNIVEI